MRLKYSIDKKDDKFRQEHCHLSFYLKGKLLQRIEKVSGIMRYINNTGDGAVTLQILSDSRAECFSCKNGIKMCIAA